MVFLIRDPFDNLTAVKRYKPPLLIVHGNRDEVVPYQHGTALHQASPHSEMITYDAGHNDCPPDWSDFYLKLTAFLKKHAILPGEAG